MALFAQASYGASFAPYRVAEVSGPTYIFGSNS